MTDPNEPPKDGESFFRKVVRFVANPTTDWADITKANSAEARESEYAKSELKAMIERKRRNDFVRKREFDMLRKIRREGLTGEHLSGLAGLSNLDSEARITDGVSPDGVKAKIDAIEQQMVGESAYAPRRPAPATDPSRGTVQGPLPGGAHPAMSESFLGDAPPRPMVTEPMRLDGPDFSPPVPAPSARTAPAQAAPRAPTPPAAAPKAPPPRPQAPAPVTSSGLDPLSAVEVAEVAHDPDLDEPVIAFANADFEQCERALLDLIRHNGARVRHAETWLVLFDLYRAIGNQAKFESLALDYAQQFGWSAPQWFSMPRQVAESLEADQERHGSSSARVEGSIGWVAPDALDADAVARLRSQLLQLPLPWVLDWNALRHIEAEACHQLTQLLRGWADEPIEMRWLGAEKLHALLADLAPTGVRDADPAYWLLRLEALRLANRPDQFDEVAIDYCVTYEVSPPSWESARCLVKTGGGSGSSVSSATLSRISEVSTGFVESEIEDEGLLQVATVELSGQLVGDISGLLKSLEAKLGAATIVNVSCERLIRMDFIAAGDLLNWVLTRRGEDRSVTFENAHRLVALFCGAMGINEHARVKVRNV
jgi:hypothetical protein